MREFIEEQMRRIEIELEIKKRIIKKEDRWRRLVREVELLGIYSDCLLRLATKNYMGN